MSEVALQGLAVGLQLSSRLLGMAFEGRELPCHGLVVLFDGMASYYKSVTPRHAAQRSRAAATYIVKVSNNILSATVYPVISPFTPSISLSSSLN